MKVSMSVFFKELFSGHLKTSLKTLLRLCTPRGLSRWSRKKLIELEKGIGSVKNGEWLASFCGPYGSGELYRKEWFEGYETMLFEGRKIRLPKLYDQYLRAIYGNYMRFPDIIPETTHSQYYVNLKERVSLYEACLRSEKGIKKEW